VTVRYSIGMSDSLPKDEDATLVIGPSDSGSGDEFTPRDAGPIAGAQLGRYLVIERVGRGGMGVVLRAYDSKLQREVALKLVRKDALGEAGQSRLVREARAMARLNHPNVVGLYDVELALDVRQGGVVVVMEYVAGTTLRQWLEATPRSYREVVDVFIEAGRGLSAAHAQGLLHRDFKLDNVLVGSDERVRVTDFGLVRMADSPASDEPWERLSASESMSREFELTEAGVVMGTPAYMAPEQHEGGELDPRTDQYAFCVAMWRALTGRWPVQARGSTLSKAKRAGIPAWPRDVSVPRHIVDAVRRGLSPERADRWASMQALLAELDRSPSRRRRRMLAVGVLALVGVGAWGGQRVQREREAARCADEGEQIVRTWNDDRAAEIGAALEATGISYAADTWSRSMPRLQAYAEQWQAARTLACDRIEVEKTWNAELGQAARACLDEHRDNLEALLEQLSRPDATVVEHVGGASASLPLLATCTDEVALRQRAEPPTDPLLREQVAALRSRLAEAAAAGGAGRNEEALTQAQGVLAEAKELSWRPLLAEAWFAVGAAHEGLGQYDSARKALEEAVFEAGAEGHDELAIRAGNMLAFTVGHHAAKHDEGLQWGRLSQMFAARVGRADDLVMGRLYSNLGTVHHGRGDYGKALESHERAVAIVEKTLGPEHPDLALFLSDLGIVQRTRGEHGKALELQARALAILENALGPEHPSVARVLNNLGNVHVSRGDHGKALELHERALAIRKGAQGPEHPEVATSLNNLGNLHDLRGDSDEAVPLLEEALAIWETVLGPEHPDVAISLYNLGVVYEGRDEYSKALEHYARALAIEEKTLGLEHPAVANSLNGLGSVHRSRGEHAKALEFHERALAIEENVLGAEHPSVATTLDGLGKTHSARGAHAKAVEAYERAVAIREAVDGMDTELAATRLRLAGALWESNRDRARAFELAKAARDTYRALGPEAADAFDEADQWLVTHVVP
jgi:eukaryotic-like serine/threonine-protein kinase